MANFIKKIPVLGFSTVPTTRYTNGPLECYVSKTVAQFRALFFPLKASGVPVCNLTSMVVALQSFIKTDIPVEGRKIFCRFFSYLREEEMQII